jgi:hypothetical protein
MSNKASFFLTSLGEHCYHDVSDDTINIEVDRESLGDADPRVDDIDGAFLCVKSKTELGEILIRAFDLYRAEAEKGVFK